jgi:hypothetical protein
MLKDGSITRVNVNLSQMNKQECEACLRSKASRKPIADVRSSPQAKNFRDFIHMDLWGPAPVQTIHHALYTLTMLDDASSWLEKPLLKFKDKAFAKYVTYNITLETQHGIQIKCVPWTKMANFCLQIWSAT